MQFDIFALKAPPLYGLDIGNSAIKLVELSVDKKGVFRVERYVIEPLPKEVVVDGNIVDAEQVSATIQRAVHRFGSSLKSVALGLPSAAVITRRVNMPSAFSSAEIEAQVPIEAEQNLPFDISEVSLDFQVLGPSERVVGDVEVLIAAARKEKIDERLASANLAGLKVLVVDAESLATAEAMKLVAPPEKYQNRNVAYAQIDSDTVSISVYRNGDLIFSRDQPFGSTHLLTEIMQQYDVSAEIAEQMRVESSKQPATYQEMILDPFYDLISQEIQRALQMFITSTAYIQADLLVLGGPLASAEGLSAKIINQVGFDTLIANPFSAMKYGAAIREVDLLRDAPALVTACGLALRRFDDYFRNMFEEAALADADPESIGWSGKRLLVNALPHREQKRVASRRQFGYMAGAVAAGGLVIGLLVHGVISGYISVQESRNSFISSENVKLDGQIEEIKRINSDIDALLARKQVIESLQSDRAQAIQILDQMVRIAPAGLYLNSMKQAGLKVAINGFAPSSEQVSEFMVNVQNSPYLERPELVEIKASQVGGRRLAEFSMNFSLKRPKAEDAKLSDSKKDGAPAATSPGVGKSVVAPIKASENLKDSSLVAEGKK